MNILVIGLGAIGKKHLNTLENLKNEYGLEIFKFEPTSYENRIYFRELSRQIKDGRIDVAVICNPTILHYQTLNLCLRLGLHVFVEKPLSHDYKPKQFDVLMKLAVQKGLRVMLGYDMRFSPWIIKAREIIEKGLVGDVWSARIIAGQYLPDWRQGDYRNVYSAKKELGGGVLLDLSHEIDYLTWLMVKKIKTVTARKSYTKRIQIETEDICEIVIEYADKSLAEIHLDYLNVPYRRALEVYGEKGTLIWDGNLSTLLLYTDNPHKPRIIGVKEVSQKEIFFNEFAHFFYCIKNKKDTRNSLGNAIYVNKIIDCANKSARLNKGINF